MLASVGRPRSHEHRLRPLEAQHAGELLGPDAVLGGEPLGEVAPAPADLGGECADVDPARHHLQAPPRLGGLRLGARRDLDAGRQRPQQHAFDDGEAIGPRCGRGVEAVEQLTGEAPPQHVERHHLGGQRTGRQAEQRPCPGRRDGEHDAVLVAVVADDDRAGVQAAEQGVEAGELAPAIRAAARARADRRS